jgi:hypothetical protein
MDQGDLEFRKEIIRCTHKSLEENIPIMWSCLQTHDWQNLYRLAHGAKGIAMAIGMMQVYEAFLDL